MDKKTGRERRRLFDDQSTSQSIFVSVERGSCLFSLESPPSSNSSQPNVFLPPLTAQWTPISGGTYFLYTQRLDALWSSISVCVSVIICACVKYSFRFAKWPLEIHWDSPTINGSLWPSFRSQYIVSMQWTTKDTTLWNNWKRWMSSRPFWRIGEFSGSKFFGDHVMILLFLWQFPFDLPVLSLPSMRCYSRQIASIGSDSVS